MPKNATKINYRKATFVEMLIEQHQRMWKNNNNMKGSHPYKSHPLTWPVQERGMMYWTSIFGNAQIYLLGNPVTWWLSTKSIVFYLGAFVVGMILAQRSIKGGIIRNGDKVVMYEHISRSSGFLFVGWAVHYIPFFFMDRELYLHHYLPALYFSVLLFTTFFDLAITGASFSRKMIVSGLLIMLVLWSFSKFYPLSYGSQMSDVSCKSLKWKKKWDINCGTEQALNETFAEATRVPYADEVEEPPEVIFKDVDNDE